MGILAARQGTMPPRTPTLPSMSIDTTDLLAANAAFYDAFEQRSAPAMDAVWSSDDLVSCTHPGWATLHGAEAVQRSWRSILGGPQHLQFIVSDVRAHVSGDVGWVTCVENLLADDGPHGSAAALNLFRRSRHGVWRMVAHHASPVMQRP